MSTSDAPSNLLNGLSITRRLEFDMGHTVTGHEGKCRHLHGHRYTVELVCAAESLDNIGRVIDFGEIKRVVGTWIDDNWDHKFMIWSGDVRMPALHNTDKNSLVIVDFVPTAENISAKLMEVASRLLADRGISVKSLRLYETPNGWADCKSV